MSLFGKIIGGGLGFALGGPIGAIIGVAIGHQLDRRASNLVAGGAFDSGFDGMGRAQSGVTQGDFAVVLLVLSAAVMKADGKVLRSELKYVRSFFEKQFGPIEAAEQMKLLKNILNQDFQLRQVCLQIRHHLSHPMRLQLMHYLFGIAQADGHIDDQEVEVINRIANYLGISVADFESIRAMFVKGPGTAASYTILEVDPKATDAEVKKAYRKMAVKYHPDKISDLGPEFQDAAREKFQKVQDAYETIKKERGLK